MKRSDIIITIAENIGMSLFISMLNPKFRGDNFRYSTFDISRHIRNTIEVSVPWKMSETDILQVETIVKSSWDKWITEAGDGIPSHVR